METVLGIKHWVDEVFKDTTVDLDHATFTRCTFASGCRLVYRGLTPVIFLDGTIVEPGCQWFIRDAAQNTLRLLTQLRARQPELFEQLVPLRAHGDVRADGGDAAN